MYFNFYGDTPFPAQLQGGGIKWRVKAPLLGVFNLVNAIRSDFSSENPEGGETTQSEIPTPKTPPKVKSPP